MAEAREGKYRLFERTELQPDWSPMDDSRLTVWEVLQPVVTTASSPPGPDCKQEPQRPPLVPPTARNSHLLSPADTGLPYPVTDPEVPFICLSSYRPVAIDSRRCASTRAPRARIGTPNLSRALDAGDPAARLYLTWTSSADTDGLGFELIAPI